MSDLKFDEKYVSYELHITYSVRKSFDSYLHEVYESYCSKFGFQLFETFLEFLLINGSVPHIMNNACALDNQINKGIFNDDTCPYCSGLLDHDDSGFGKCSVCGRTWENNKDS